MTDLQRTAWNWESGTSEAAVERSESAAGLTSEIRRASVCSGDGSSYSTPFSLSFSCFPYSGSLSDLLFNLDHDLDLDLDQAIRRSTNMNATPPTFQESSRCDVCLCSFTTFRRRHHCRCCGRTLCHEHSSYYMALPQFGIFSDVRVCADCLNGSSRSENNGKQASTDADFAAENARSLTSDSLSDGLSKLGLSKDATAPGPTTSQTECKCGMPLCICVTQTPEPTPPKLQNSTISSTPSSARVKNTVTIQQPVDQSSRKFSSSSSSTPSSFFNLGQASNGSLDKGSTRYDVTGEGIREAIKNRDATAVKELLSKGVDANFCDRQGMTLLHLAAVFNQTEIAFVLIDHGANMESRNAQGETPIDCSPTMLQNKMRQKMEELRSIAQS